MLCGSDVALGLDARARGPAQRVLAVRRGAPPRVGHPRHPRAPEDFFASYWRYQRWVVGGDPYFSPNLSLAQPGADAAAPHEPTAAERMSVPLGRDFKVFRSRVDAAEAGMLAEHLPRHRRPTSGRCGPSTRPTPGRSRCETVNWFLPDIDSPFYGGINTALRMADKLARDHGVENRFVVSAPAQRGVLPLRHRRRVPRPGAVADRRSHDGSTRCDLETLPAGRRRRSPRSGPPPTRSRSSRRTRRKFYLIQDFEPMFYPAGTLYALAEETYRARPLRPLQHRAHARALRDALRRQGHVVHARGRPDGVPRRGSPLERTRRPGHGVPLRPPGPLAELLGARRRSRWRSSSDGSATACAS